MKRLLSVALGIIAALGGFVDIGELVFNSQAGALFGYRTLWAILVGVIVSVVLAELSGRVAIVARKANFDLVRDRYPRWLSTTTLVAGLAVCLITLSAELGGIGLLLHYLLGWNEGFFTLVGLLIIVASSLLLSFSMIERVFGYLGLGLVVYLVAAIHHGPAWHEIGRGLIPSGGGPQYWYFVVGMTAAAMMPYEIYFYSSGAIEEKWTTKDLPVNRANSGLGFPLGGLIAASLTVVAAQQLMPLQLTPDSLATVLQQVLHELGPIAFYAAAIGAFAAIGGATIDSAFSCGYALAQHQRWTWGESKGIRGAPRWFATMLAAAGIGFAIVQTRVDPLQLTEYAVIASAVAMPLSFYPIVRASQDREVMGEHASGIVARPMAWLSYAVVCTVAVAGPVLMLVTHMGELK
ncbi:Mn2+/Fe2+ NRAMP family transporter [Kribbella sp. VKM Ac-2571]|uniref:NRAMP family divalent metal transporter n=1 Tax=Kribbella sp. VKM Ac-2571 TaxID=2512222 RepID=UPI001060FBC5|nr:divalent metal cation transporter [Kribbella sp. VKM Ac-2571]TDO66522.1 Mn2+/Fe2+ NRAMP family transporter [Kribbella sp. VKM Ac-2571]